MTNGVLAKNLINFTPIKHNPSNELHISFPKEILCRDKKEANTAAEQRTLTYQEKDYKAIQRIIRVAIEELTDETKGRRSKIVDILYNRMESLSKAEDAAEDFTDSCNLSLAMGEIAKAIFFLEQ